MKKIIYLALAAIIAVSFSSCLMMLSSTHKLTVDKNAPEDQNVTVTFVNDTREGWFALKEWNGNNIENDVYGKNGVSSNDKTKLTVPAGNTSFSFTAYYTFSNRYSSYTHTFKGIELRYNLEPGKVYEVKGRTASKGFLKGYELFVGIYDVTGKKTLLKEWKLGET